MLTCQQCSWENPDYAAFCTNCGTALGGKRKVAPSGDSWRFRGQIPERAEKAMDPEQVHDIEPGPQDEGHDPEGLVPRGEAPANDVATANQPEGEGTEDLPDAPEEGINPKLEARPAGAGVQMRNVPTLIDLTVPDFRAMVGRPESDPDNSIPGEEPEDGGRADDESSAHEGQSDAAVDESVAAAEDSAGGADSDKTVTASALDLPEDSDPAFEEDGQADSAEGDAEHTDPGENADVSPSATASPEGSAESAKDDGGAPDVPGEAAAAMEAPTHVTLADVPEVSSGPSDADRDVEGVGEFDETDGEAPALNPAVTPPAPARVGGAIRDLGSLDVTIESLDGSMDIDDVQLTVRASESAHDFMLSSVDMAPVEVERVPLPSRQAPAIERAEIVPPPMPNGNGYALRALGTTGRRLIPLEDEHLIIGRDGDVTVAGDEFISPKHARIGLDEAGAWIEDLGSLNGVWIRTQGPFELTVNDQFLIGMQVFQVLAANREACQPVTDGEGTRRLGTERSRSPFSLAQLAAGGTAVATFDVPRDGCKLGRRLGYFIISDDESVSTTHAWVAPVSGDAVELRDLSTSNGCWIRVRKRRHLAAGDAVMLGRSAWKIARLSMG